MYGIRIISVSVCVIAVGLLAQGTVGAPLPAQLVSARRVFISNAGEDPLFNFKPGRSYSQFYASLKSWGHYDLVGSPSDADLILQIQLVSMRWQVSDKDSLLLPMLKLSILDSKTHTLLWVLNEKVTLGRHKDQNFNDTMNTIIEDLKALSVSQNSSSVQ